MITLTTPALINSVLGGNVPIGYDHLVLAPITLDPVARTVSAAVRLTSISNPEMDVIVGSLAIALGSGILVLKVEQLDMQRRVQLGAGGITSVQNTINAAQNSLESGLITLGLVAGLQSTGA